MLIYLIVHDMSGQELGLKIYYLPLKGMLMVHITKRVYRNITRVDGRLKDLGGL